MGKSSLIGKKGENIARDYLIGKGFNIIGQNVREKFGEIDILAIDQDKTLVFVEVKTLQKSFGDKPGITPEDNFSQAKSRKMRKIAEYYANTNPGFIDPRRGWRIDLIALTLDRGEYAISHYENV